MGILISLLFHGFRLVIWLKRLLRSLRAVDGIQRTSSKFVISSIKADESVGILRDYSEETLLNSHGLDETVEKLSDLLCSIRKAEG